MIIKRWSSITQKSATSLSISLLCHTCLVSRSLIQLGDHARKFSLILVSLGVNISHSWREYYHCVLCVIKDDRNSVKGMGNFLVCFSAMREEVLSCLCGGLSGGNMETLIN